MASDSSTRPLPPGLRLSLTTARLLLGIALVVDLYLAVVSFKSGSLAGCGPESNCERVLSSRWAYWLGLPVSASGWLVYAVLLSSTFALAQPIPSRQRRAWEAAWVSGWLVVGAALWFVSLQLFVLRAICPYCMTAHACAAAAALLILSKAPVRPAPKKPKAKQVQVFLEPQRARQLVLFAAAGLGILVLGQVAYRPKTFVTQPIAAGVKSNSVASAPRVFEVFGGQFALELDQVPLVGRRDAPHVMVSLFDYTCHHCRELHHPIMQTFQQFSNDLAIVSLPMPLDGKCNPIMKQTPAAHTNACALARIGLTVWRAAPDRFVKFDEWIFGSATPPLPAAAEQYARQLVGTNTFDQAAADPWVSSQLKQDIAIFETSFRQFKRGLMPQVIIGTNILSGMFTREQLSRELADQFGLSAVP